jgi:hypothetical protein
VGGGRVETVSCASRKYDRAACKVGRARDVQLRRQTSNSECVRGRSWDYDGRDIWVDDGCAGEFDVYR